MAAAEALARANENLERRVQERTAELLDVNQALAIAKAKADEASLDKTRFLAAASHDILQPLNAARLYATSLAERPAEPGAEKLARNIDTSLEAVEEILGTLLDMSRLDAGQFAPEIRDISLADMFDRLRVEFEPMARAKGLELRFVSTRLWVRSDPRLLRRVLQNLMANAVKYTRSGRVLVGVRRRGDSVVLQVSDTGPGIPPAKHGLIFKEFHRLEETAATVKGLGLGLSIVERIARVLGSPVGVTSVQGRGSTFFMPLARGEPQTRPVRPPAAAPVGIDIAGRLILCIDNERQVLAGMETLLNGWGCEVITAESAEDAIEALHKLTRMPDIILADYHLDAGTGIEAVAAVRKVVGEAAPAVIITADHSAEVQRQVRGAECGLLRKPLKAGALRALFSQYMLRRSAAAE